MRDGIHLCLLLASVSSLGYGLNKIHPAAMFIGLGLLGISLVWSARTPRVTNVDSSNHARKGDAGIDA